MSAYIGGEEIREALIDAGVVTDDGYPSNAEEVALERLGTEVTALLRDRAKAQYPEGVPQTEIEFIDLDEDDVTLDFYKLARDTLDAFDQGPWQLLSAHDKHKWSVAFHELAQIAEREVNEELESFEDDEERPDWDYLFDVGDYLGKPAMLQPSLIREEREAAIARHRGSFKPTLQEPEPAAAPAPARRTKGKIVVGDVYTTKVSGRDVPVRVVQDMGRGVSRRYRVQKLDGRPLTKLRSARALKPRS